MNGFFEGVITHYIIDFREHSKHSTESISETFFVNYAQFKDLLQQARTRTLTGTGSYISDGMFLDLSKDPNDDNYKIREFIKWLKLEFDSSEDSIDKATVERCINKLKWV